MKWPVSHRALCSLATDLNWAKFMFCGQNKDFHRPQMRVLFVYMFVCCDTRYLLNLEKNWTLSPKQNTSWSPIKTTPPCDIFFMYLYFKVHHFRGVGLGNKRKEHTIKQKKWSSQLSFSHKTKQKERHGKRGKKEDLFEKVLWTPYQIHKTK